MAMTRIHFEEQLEGVRRSLLEMGSSVDRMVETAMRALSEQDAALAEEVIAEDDGVDEQDVSIERECLRLIALQAPVARDLHLLGTAMKAITDLERIGDHAVDIAKVARKLAAQPFNQPLADIPHMALCVRQMLRDALAAFVHHDLELVDRVVDADDEVDRLFHQVRDDLHAAMRRDAAVVVQASYLLFVAHYLERIADHAVNIAERVYFAETGHLEQLAKSHRTQS